MIIDLKFRLHISFIVTSRGNQVFPLESPPNSMKVVSLLQYSIKGGVYGLVNGVHVKRSTVAVVLLILN